MNIDLTISAAITKVSVVTIQKDSVVRRVCRMVLSREFDSTIAAALGGDATTALEALKSHGISEVTLPIDTIEASCKMVSVSQTVTIPVLHGRKAKGKAGDDDKELPPSIKLEFQFEFFEPAWVFLGRNAAAWTEATLSETQPSLPGVDTSKSRPRPGA